MSTMKKTAKIGAAIAVTAATVFAAGCANQGGRTTEPLGGVLGGPVVQPQTQAVRPVDVKGRVSCKGYVVPRSKASCKGHHSCQGHK